MAVDILQNCYFDLSKIKTLYIGSRLTDGNPIVYPLEYTTLSGSSDSIISVQAWDYNNDTVTIGSQTIQLNQITNLGDNLSFSEDYITGLNGKVYEKVISFTVPNITTFLINQLKEFTISSAGKFALSPTISFIIDENEQTLIVGYDRPLYLQNQDFQMGEENQVTLTYKSTSQSRSRAYVIL